MKGALHEVSPWSVGQAAASRRGPIESLSLRDGMTLMLSRFEAREVRRFHHVELQDVFAIGFHLRGDAQFTMGDATVATRPLDVWAGTGPRSSTSLFSLPEHGFCTVSLRFTPAAANEFIESHGADDTPLANVARISSEELIATRLVSLDTAGAQTVEAMLTAPYTGSARRLFLESGALALLAAQVEDHSRNSEQRAAVLRLPIRQRLMQARTILQQSLVEPPSIIALARIVGINEFDLKRGFKQLFGTTVFGYVRRCRMERAAVDLQAGLPVAQAAAAVGYQCPRCFADAFRRHHGVLPSEVTRRTIAKLPRTAD